MKKAITLILLSFVLVFTALVPSCSSGVDKNQYDRAIVELQTLRDKRAKAQIYGLFLDLLMSEFYQKANLQSRYQFSSTTEWTNALDLMAKTVADPKIISLLGKMKTASADDQFLVLLEMEDYLTEKIVTTLQN